MSLIHIQMCIRDRFLTRGEMPVTMCRLNLVKGQGPVLQIAEGWTVNLDKDVFKAINERTDRTWPSTFFAPRLTGKGYFRDVYTVMNLSLIHISYTEGIAYFWHLRT